MVKKKDEKRGLSLKSCLPGIEGQQERDASKKVRKGNGKVSHFAEKRRKIQADPRRKIEADPRGTEEKRRKKENKKQLDS